jgi:AcrR family transcriptional regulator
VTVEELSVDPRTKKGQQTRERIVETAAALMLENGVAGTTVEDVCEAARVGKSQIYHYFADKSALTRGVIEFQTDRVLGHQQSLFSPMTSWEDWDIWREQIVEMQRRLGCIGGCPIGSLASELADADALACEVLNKSFDRWENIFRVGIEQMKYASILVPEADPMTLATFILGALQGGLLLCQTRKDVAPLQVSLDGALAHLRSYARTVD